MFSERNHFLFARMVISLLSEIIEKTDLKNYLKMQIRALQFASIEVRQSILDHYSKEDLSVGCFVKG